MAQFDASEEAAKLKSDTESGISISDAYNSLSEDERKAVFQEMTSSEDGDANLSNLIISGEDTDGDRKPDVLGDIFDPSTGKDLYDREGEDSNSDEAWNRRWGPIIKSDPEFREHFKEIISGGGAYEGPMAGGLSATAIRRDSLQGMIEKHGLDRVKETFGALEEIGGSKGFYAHSLHKGYSDGREDIERKMGYLDKIMEPGTLESARQLGRIFDEEGFNKNPSLKELADPEFTKMLIENREEREAYKAYNEAPMGPMMGFHRKYGDSVDEMLPSERMDLYKQYEKEWKEAREEENRPFQEEVDKHGKSPEVVLTEAMKNNDVLIIGERHLEDSPLREEITPLIDELKEAGATHFAVEMRQDQLDAYLKDGNMEHLPPGLRHKDYVDLLDKVREEGLELVPANISGGDQERDDHMASVISDILKEDPDNKVVFWVGALHGADTSAGAYLSTANLLRNQGVDVATTIAQSSATSLDSLFNKVKVDEPTAIKTEDTPNIKDLELVMLQNDIDEYYRLWDIVILFPRDKKE